MKKIVGGTRVVFIFKNYVIKIPRLNILRSILRLIYHIFKWQAIDKIKNFDPNKNIIKGGLKYILYGVYSNKLEYYFSKKNKKDDRIVHVYGLLYYFILIQKRVEEISEDDERWKSFVDIYLKKGVKDVDMLVTRNFGFLKDKIKLIDYGREETILTLNQLILN